MVEQDKPFKTIEVIDGATREVCKVACMSCIRGHRTTSCGIPVCRSKVFWTVKRPGRPSNSCTCRYGGSGRCKCVVAKSACPHKPKKGEKRSGECRCDEQGRYCCLIEPEHWNMLLALHKPTIAFYPSREALEARHQPITLPMTPAYSSPSTQTFGSGPSTPTATSDVQSPRAHLAPRLGMMGVGGPQGNHHVTPDILSWQGQAPQAPPQAFQSPSYHSLPPPPVVYKTYSSCCGTTEAESSPVDLTVYTPNSIGPPPGDAAGFTNGLQRASTAEQTPIAPAFHVDKMTLDYLNYQFPSAICQKCGLNGCTCKHCPPVLQNFSNGAWASMCARKHARPPEPTFTTSSLPPVLHHTTSDALDDKLNPLYFTSYPHDSGFGSINGYMGSATQHLDPHSPPHVNMSDISGFDLHEGLGDSTEPMNMDLSDLLMSHIDDQSSGRGCCSP